MGIPYIVVRKKDGGIRLCIDLREPNQAVIADSFPLPHTKELLNSLVGAAIFTILDLASMYHEVLLHPESRDLTAFVTHDSLFHFKRVCFGLASAPAAFQQQMSQILKGCSGILFYIENIIVFGHTEEHLMNLVPVLCRIKAAGLKLNHKYTICVKDMSFLGHGVTAQGVSLLPEKMNSIQHNSAPMDTTGLC